MASDSATASFTAVGDMGTVALCINVLLSFFGSMLVAKGIPAVTSTFLAAGLSGRDMCKKDQKQQVPESMGIVSGTVFLVVMFVFLGVRFSQHMVSPHALFPHQHFEELLTALLSICCMLLLGFCDDVLNLKWRYKLMLPTLASLPLLMVYYANFGSTTIIVPVQLRPLLGGALNIGLLYYLYMALLAIFCTNAINIYAGVNGLESGQAMVMSASVCIFNLLELPSYQSDAHFLSLSIMIPFTFTTAALYHHNRYPARAFVGDTFTYFAGMTFAVVGILGHFSKTVMLFFIPQLFNFAYSLPQLVRLLPCPRHRLPLYQTDSGVLVASTTTARVNSLHWVIVLALRLLARLKLVSLKEKTDADDQPTLTFNNLTLINLVLNWSGPLHEAALTRRLLLIQCLSSCLAFIIRYPLASLFF